MFTHEVQYQIGRMPIHQGFTLELLLSGKDWQRAPLGTIPRKHNQTGKFITRPTLTPDGRARKRVWNTARKMKCIEHEAIPGQRAHVLWRSFAPGEESCQGCPFDQTKSSGCVMRDRGLMRYFIERAYPLEIGMEEAPPSGIPVEFPMVTRAIQWELPVTA